LNKILGFTPLPLSLLLVLVGITVAYITASEVAKRIFYRRVQM
jgi:tetrahydromethanopterin S-methyltransferase subunit E